MGHPRPQLLQLGGGPATNTLKWAEYSDLASPTYFLVTESLLNIEREVGAAGGHRNTDALYYTRRVEYPWAFLQIPGDAQSVLDAGGGPATFQYMLARHIPVVYNVDSYPDWVERVGKTKALLKNMGELVMVTRDLCDLSNFKDKSFDATTCISVMEHAGADKASRIIDELLRVTKGPILMTVDVGSGDLELMPPDVLYALGERYKFTVPDLPIDAMYCKSGRGNGFHVACIRLEG